MGSAQLVKVLTETSWKAEIEGATSVLVFGDVTVHVHGRKVRGPRGDARLEPTTLRLLLRLVGAPGLSLSREDLIEAVWDRGAGSDESLSQAIARLRRALGDDARAPRFIETAPKLGYRWIFESPPAVAIAATSRREPRPGRALARAWLVALAAVGAGAGSLATLAYDRGAGRPAPVVRRVLIANLGNSHCPGRPRHIVIRSIGPADRPPSLDDLPPPPAC